MAVNDQLGDVSYLGFQAALAGYIAALVCFGIEFASARGTAPTATEAISVARRAAGGGRTAVLEDRGAAGALGAGADGGIGRISKPPKPSRRPMGPLFGLAAIIVTVLGYAAHLFSIVTRGIAAGRAPWGNMYEFTSLICAAAVTGFLVVLHRTRSRAVGFFVMIPVVILMFVGGTKLYTQVESLVPALRSYWLLIHVLAVSLSTGVLMVSGVASAMYLLRSRYERKLTAEQEWSKKSGNDVGGPADLGSAFVPQATVAANSRLASLPSLAVLDRVAYRTAIVAFPVYTFAVIAGALWAEVAWGRYWGWDPKETCAFVSWVFYAAYLHARATAGWRGTRAAWISVLGFVSVVFNLFFINIVVSGLHSYAGLN